MSCVDVHVSQPWSMQLGMVVLLTALSPALTWHTGIGTYYPLKDVTYVLLPSCPDQQIISEKLQCSDHY